MQNKLKLLLMVASLAIAATFVLVACGNGEMIMVQGDLLDQKNEARDKLLDPSRMSSIMDSEDEPDPESSSSKEEEKSSSSSSEKGGDSSSSSAEKSSSSSKTSGSSSSQSSTQSSSSSAPKSSSSAVIAPSGSCKENDPKSGYTCGWNVTGTLTPGTVLKPKDPKAPSGCSDVKWYFAPGTAAMQLKNECEEVPADGFKALGSKEYVLFAELTCDGKKHTTACDPKDGLSSKEAPVLKGECKWDKAPTTTARGAIPSGVSVVDTDKICTNPTVVYKYSGGTKDWPKTGILDEWKNWSKNDIETYEVEATLNCSAYPQTVTSPCPPLEVSGGVEHVIECTCDKTPDKDGKEPQCQVEAKICKADGKAGNSVTLTESECVEVNVYGYNNPHYMPEVGMRCQTSNNTSFTVTVNGKSTEVKGNGLIPIGKLEVKDEIYFGTLCLTTGSTISCSGPGQ